MIALCLLVACGDNRAACLAGEQVACGCPGGALGAQVCHADGTFGACAGCPADAGIETVPTSCASQTDCPIGYDCGLALAGDTTPSCYRRSYDTAAGGFGTSCAIAVCTGALSPCAPSFRCTSGSTCDPAATCTHVCASDPDCPPTMFCAVDLMCAPREACDPCVIDDQCGPAARCATDGRGERYCAKTCDNDADCPQPQADDITGTKPHAFEHCVADLGGRGMVCQPADGYCHGPSAIPSQPDGGVCAWCRPGENDCTVGTCFASLFTTERFCTTTCMVDMHWNGTAYEYQNDTCPTDTYCYAPAGACSPPSDCTFPSSCVGDPARQFVTCYP